MKLWWGIDQSELGLVKWIWLVILNFNFIPFSLICDTITKLMVLLSLWQKLLTTLKIGFRKCSIGKWFFYIDHLDSTPGAFVVLMVVVCTCIWWGVSSVLLCTSAAVLAVQQKASAVFYLAVGLLYWLTSFSLFRVKWEFLVQPHFKVAEIFQEAINLSFHFWFQPVIIT